MNASEAREHLEMIERIISASSHKLETGAEYFVVWGLAGAAFDVVDTLAYGGRIPLGWLWVNFLILALAIGFTVVRSRTAGYAEKGRMSILQREYLNVLWLAIAVAFVTSLIGFNLFALHGSMAVWNVVEAIVLFYIGMHGNRRAQICGLVMIVTIALANFMPSNTGFILAAGPLLGWGGFGIAELLAKA
ncbi:MAG TPA: hypothetical protein VFN49_04315 [Candidatus Aquilonibacter sp.]|nr:hypothetical protein [Candidatus Aquilonibacter sp.]